MKNPEIYREEPVSKEKVIKLLLDIRHCTPDQYDFETTPQGKTEMMKELNQLNKKYMEYKKQNPALVAQAEKEFTEDLG